MDPPAQPTASTTFVIVETSKAIRFKNYEEKLRAKLLWPPFFKWDPVNYEDLQSYFLGRFRALIKDLGLDDFNKADDRRLEGLVSLSLFLPPSEWRQEALESKESSGAKRMEITILATIVNLYLDDILDSYESGPGPQYNELKQAITDAVSRVIEQEFKDLEALYAYLQSTGSGNNPLLAPKFKTALALQQKTTEKLREDHGIVTKDYSHLETEVRLSYDYLTMYSGGWDECFYDTEIWDCRRCYTSAGYALLEWFFTLCKLNLHPYIREDKYFARLRHLVVRLNYLTNDILSFEKEASEEENPNNSIAHFVALGHDLATAMNKTVEAFNDCVRELCTLKEYLDSGKHPIPTDPDPSIAAELEHKYREAIRLTFAMAEGHFQAHISSSRYTNIWRFE